MKAPCLECQYRKREKILEPCYSCTDKHKYADFIAATGLRVIERYQEYGGVEGFRLERMRERDEFIYFKTSKD